MSREVLDRSAPRQLLEQVLNLSKYHREHEKFYAQSPLLQAIALQHAAQVFTTFADRWRIVEVHAPGPTASPYMGCDDLNEPATIQYSGVLFLEDVREPAEIGQLKRELRAYAASFGESGQWLATAMNAAWQAQLPLLNIPVLAGVLGERHRIVINDWQSAQLQSLIALVITRSLEILDRVDFSPPAVRADLAGPRSFPGYLYATAELLARASDLIGESAGLVHDNERRWRVFHERVHQVLAEAPANDAEPSTPTT